MQETKRKVPMWERRLVFVDFETTGTTVGYHEIIQIGAATLEQSPPYEPAAVSLYIQPKHEERAEKEALAVNGYSRSAWDKKNPVDLRDAVQALEDNCFDRPDSMLVAWGGTFEKDFLRAAYREVGRKFPSVLDYHVLCVASMAWPLVHAREIRSVSLAAVCDYFQISNEGAHDAMRDVERMARCFAELRRMELVLPSQGVTLAESG